MPARLQYLFEQYLHKTASTAERKELMGLALEPGMQKKVEELISRAWEQTGEENDLREEKAEIILEQLFSKRWVSIENEMATLGGRLIDGRKKFSWRKIAAAVVLVILATSAYFLFFNKNGKGPEIVKEQGTPKDVKAPATNRAMITMADGRKVYLDSVANGRLATAGNVQIVKLADGKIAYSEFASASPGKEIVYNTLTNPRGSKVIDMMLADGSRVWLNAASSITYPIAFVGNERKVSITGEAYFEVAHRLTPSELRSFPSLRSGTPSGEGGKTIPFFVKFSSPSVGGREGTVQVLGTHFNINAYDDEADIKVTLLEGSVKISNDGNTQRLAPGQQAQVNADGKIILNVNTAIEQVMAWKNGLFAFERADLKTVMKELARWYDVEVEYEEQAPGMQFGGKLQRNLSLSQVLRALNKSQVHFRIEGNRIIIMK